MGLVSQTTGNEPRLAKQQVISLVPSNNRINLKVSSLRPICLTICNVQCKQVVAEATTLRLSYKNVLKIDNLQGFSRLTKLCLDNNIIESIRFVCLAENGISAVQRHACVLVDV